METVDIVVIGPQRRFACKLHCHTYSYNQHCKHLVKQASLPAALELPRKGSHAQQWDNWTTRNPVWLLIQCNHMLLELLMLPAMGASMNVAMLYEHSMLDETVRRDVLYNDKH